MKLFGKNFINRAFLFIFPLILSAVFCIFPINILAEDIKPEDIINQEKIELKEKDAENILLFLIQHIKDNWIDISASSDNFKLEDQAGFNNCSKTQLSRRVAGYLLFEAPKEITINIINATFKVVRLISSEDISVYYK